MDMELSGDKQSAQIRELTRLVLSLRDEMHKKNSGFFGSSKKGSEPIPPELEFSDTPSPKPSAAADVQQPKNVECRVFSDLSSTDLSPLMHQALLLSAVKFEFA